MKNTNTFIIFATFSRRYDELHNTNNNIHLQVSVAAIRSELDYLGSDNEIPLFETADNKNIIIIRVYPDSRYFSNSNETKYDFNLIQISDTNWVVETTIESLIGHLIFDKTSHKSEIMHQIFGAFQDKSKSKDVENIPSNCLFEFRNGLNMANIATLFKLSNIDISGGNITNRSALKSTQFNLSWFLINLYNNCSKDWLNYNIIYPFTNNTSNSVLSTKVNKRLYGQLDNWKFREKYPLKITKSATETSSIKDEVFLNNLYKYIEYNEQYTKNIFINDMLSQIPKIIQNLEKDIRELTSEVELLSIIKLNLTKRTSKYAEKQNIKHIEELLSKKKEIEILNNKLNEINKWLSKKDSWNQCDISILQKWHEIIISKRFSVSEIKNKNLSRSKKMNPTSWGVKNYSTSLVTNKKTYYKDLSSVAPTNRGLFYYSSNAYLSVTHAFTSSSYSTSSSYNSTSSISVSTSASNSTTDSSSIYPSSSDATFSSNTLIDSDTILNNAKDKIKIDNNLTFGFLNSIKDLINTLKSSDNIENLEDRKRELQIFIESEWITIVKNSMSDNKNLNNNLKRVIKHVQESVALGNYKRRSKRIIPVLTDTIENIEYVLITFALIISYHNKMGYTALAQIIGNNIIYYYYKNVIMGTKDNIEWNNFKKINNITDRRSVLLGDYFLTCFDFSGIIYREYNHAKSDIALVKLNKDYLDEIKKNLIISPSTLPMLCKPAKWGYNKYGGFLENEILKKEVYTKSPSNKHKMENKELLYNAVNYLNSIQFAINIDLLNFLDKEGNSFLYNDCEADITESEILQKVITIKIAETYKNIPFYLNTHADWRGRLYTNSFFISYQGSDLSASLLLLYNGETLTDQGKEYLYIYGANLFDEKINDSSISKKPYNERIKWVKDNYEKIINLDIDFIKKAESKFLFAAFCLTLKKIHKDPNYKVNLPVFLDATCSGIQHLSTLLKDEELAKKVNLTPQTNSDSVKDIYSEIKDDINKAINKYGIMNPDFSYLTDVKLTRDILKVSIMTKVYNVTTYGISKQLQNKLQAVWIDPDNELELQKRKNINLLSGVNVDNDNSLKLQWHTNYSDIKEKFNEDNTAEQCVTLDNKEKYNFQKGKNKLHKEEKRVQLFIAPGLIKPVYLNRKEVFKIAEIIYNQIFELFPSLKFIYDYFMDISKLMIKLEIPLSWFTPIGLKLTQHYLKSKINKISISMGGRNKTLVLRDFVDEINNRKQNQAIIPNIIHSLDASHLIKLLCSVAADAERENGLNYIIPVHDCFGTHPNQLGILEQKVKREFIWIYTNEKFLVKFHDKIIKNIKDNNLEIINKDNKMFVIFYNNDKEELLYIPDLPKEGKFNINDILEAKHMIT
jgi:hypothetical protein